MPRTSQRLIDLTPLDYSKEAITKAVRRISWENPVVTLTGAVGGIGTCAALVLNGSWLFALPLVVAAGVFSFNYFVRRDSIAASYLLNYSVASRKQAEILAAYLREEFAELGYERGAQQIEMLKRHLITIAHALEERFDVNDISYQQFLGPAEVLYMQTLNVLKDASIQLRANQTFDEGYDGKAGKDTGGNVSRRKELYEGGVQRFNALIESVESAITGLAELTQDVARIGSGSEAHGHDDYIQRVREVASRANLYVDQKRI